MNYLHSDDRFLPLGFTEPDQVAALVRLKVPIMAKYAHPNFHKQLETIDGSIKFITVVKEKMNQPNTVTPTLVANVAYYLMHPTLGYGTQACDKFIEKMRYHILQTELIRSNAAFGRMVVSGKINLP